MSTETTTALPTWSEMTDVDKGCALLHLWKRNWEGTSYAIENYPAVYLDHPTLTALEPRAASRHAARVAGSWDDANDRLGEDEVQRLYDLALEEPDRRCLWAAGDANRVFPCKTEQEVRDLLMTWARNDANPPAWYKPRDPSTYRFLMRDEPGGEWVELTTTWSVTR